VQLGVASRFVALSNCTSTTPDGCENSRISEYIGSTAAFFMNSAQIGAAVCAPLSRRSL